MLVCSSPEMDASAGVEKTGYMLVSRVGQSCWSLKLLVGM